MADSASKTVSALQFPQEAEILKRVQETPTIFSLSLRFTDPELHHAYRFEPGQFNMLYLPGVGEVPISIASDPADKHCYEHTIRTVGRVTRAMARLQEGDRVGVRGPYGRGWPMEAVQGRDILIATGGLGCAPVVSVINYVMRRRDRYGSLTIVQGVKHTDDLIWRDSYDRWSQARDTQVLLAANEAGPQWRGYRGYATVALEDARVGENAVVMMCGPQPMMSAVAGQMLARNIAAEDIWLSMERNMNCANGLCGHCQMGAKFVCRDGPVFSYREIGSLMRVRGF